MILTLAAFFGLPAAVYDTISRFHAIEASLPAWAVPYLPVTYISAFVIGLAVLGTAPDEDPDISSLHEANTRHENRLATLGAELESKKNQIAELEAQLPREITHAQRAAVAESLEAMPEYQSGDDFSGKHFPYRPRILIGALPNASDSRHLAEALEEVLQFRFDVEWIRDKACLTYYSMQDVTGIVLLEGREKWWRKPREEGFEETLRKYATFVIESFAAQSLNIEFLPPSPLADLKYLTLLVGRRP